MRQQGLPLSGSIYSNTNGALARSLFIGDPNARPTSATTTRVGYTLSHRFDDWTLHNDVRLQQSSVSGQQVAANVLNASSQL